MPSVLVADKTVLLTEQGWTPARSIGDHRSIFGADRHGHLVSQEVQLEVFEGSSKNAVLGTEASCGIFHAETRLVLQGGAVRTAAEVVEDPRPADLWFENILSYPQAVDEGLCGASFVSSVESRAPFVVDGTPIIRCRSHDVQKWETISKTGTCRFKRISNEVFCLIDARGFRNLQGARLHKVVRALSVALWHNSEESRDEFDVANSTCCLWYLSALRSLRAGYRLSYDSLQHSSLVMVSEDPAQKSPFQRCRCAFYQLGPTTTVRIVWPSNSWTPVGSGFLISAR